MTEILYSSTQVHVAIKQLLENPKPKERRVAIVAYVGGGAEAYLPNPKGLELICCLEPGSTSAVTLARLRRRGARIRKANRLHMKVYWSSRKGCVISSANLSTNALGKGGLKEAGVLLPAGAVDIERLVQKARPKPISSSDLRNLRRKADSLAATLGSKNTRTQDPICTFMEWYEERGRSNWKQAAWKARGLEFAEVVKSYAKSTYGVAEPEEVVGVARSQVADGDWLLLFGVPNGAEPHWVYVDRVFRVPRSDKVAYDASYPDQAIQVHPARTYGPAPFVIDRRFRAALKEAVRGYGWRHLFEAKSLRPPERWLKLIRASLKLRKK